MLRAVIFDFDGIIADNEPIHLRMFQEVLAVRGISLSEEDYYATYLGMDDKGCFSTILALHKRPVDARIIDALIAEKTRRFTDTIQNHLVIFPGVVEFVEEAARHYPLAIASGALRHEIKLILEAAGIRKYFQTIVSAEDVTEGKPNPEGFLKARERLREITGRKLEPPECLVIEDSLAGIEAARRAGMPCLAVTNTYPKEKLRDAHKVVTSLKECPIRDLINLFN
jgi:HAD superfamily hydrolase (TIGR01509 family)